MQTTEPRSATVSGGELAGLDNLELPLRPRKGRLPAHLELRPGRSWPRSAWRCSCGRSWCGWGCGRRASSPGRSPCCRALFKDLTSDDRLVDGDRHHAAARGRRLRASRSSSGR